MKPSELLDGIPPRIQKRLRARYHYYFGNAYVPDAVPRKRPAESWTPEHAAWLQRERDRLNALKARAGLITHWNIFGDQSDLVLSIAMSIVRGRDSGAAQDYPGMVEDALQALVEYDAAAAADPEPRPLEQPEIEREHAALLKHFSEDIFVNARKEDRG